MMVYFLRDMVLNFICDIDQKNIFSIFTSAYFEFYIKR